MAVDIPTALAQLKQGIAKVESGGQKNPYLAQSSTTSASGKYQYVDGSWAGFGGYAKASLAPPAVQEQKFEQDAIRHLNRYGSVELAAVAHFQGPGTANKIVQNPDLWNKKDANGLTTKAYIDRFTKAAGSAPSFTPSPIATTAPTPSAQPSSFAELLQSIQGGGRIIQQEGRTYLIPAGQALSQASPQALPQSTPPTGTIQPKTVTGPPNWAAILNKRRVDGNEKVDFNPTLGTGLAALFQDRPELKLDSGTRDAAHQKQLWDQALIKYGTVAEARRWVAPPGRSKHENTGAGGNAADVSGLPSNRKEAQALLGQYGLTLPLSNEGWHVELIGSRKKN